MYVKVQIRWLWIGVDGRVSRQVSRWEGKVRLYSWRRM